MNNQDLKALFEIMEQFANILTLETEMLGLGNLDGLGDVVADKSMFAHKYANTVQKVMSLSSTFSPDDKQMLKTKTSELLELIKENEQAIEAQQNAHDVVIQLFQQSLNKENPSVTYTKEGAEYQNKDDVQSLALSERI